MFKGLQAGNLLRLSGAKLCRPALLGACWCTAACVPSRGAATARCSACAAFLVAAAAGAAKRVQEGLSLLLYSFVSSFQVVLCEQRCACGQVANRWVRSLSPDLGGDIDKTRTKQNVRHSVRSETPKVRHSCGGDSYVDLHCLQFRG